MSEFSVVVTRVMYKYDDMVKLSDTLLMQGYKASTENKYGRIFIRRDFDFYEKEILVYKGVIR